MKKEIVVCDVCGVARQEANHWFMCLPEEQSDGTIVIRRWDASFLGEQRFKHLCGQACVHKFVDEFLSK